MFKGFIINIFYLKKFIRASKILFKDHQVGFDQQVGFDHQGGQRIFPPASYATDRQDIKNALLEVLDNLSGNKVALDKSASHGFSIKLIEDVVKHCDTIGTSRYTDSRLWAHISTRSPTSLFFCPTFFTAAILLASDFGFTSNIKGANTESDFWLSMYSVVWVMDKCHFFWIL